MYGFSLLCFCLLSFVSAQDPQRIERDPSSSPNVIYPAPQPPPPPSGRLTEPPPPQRIYPPFPQRIIYPPPQRRVFPPIIWGNGNARRLCARHGEEPTYESNGAVQRCVWTNPPCRGREVICRTDGSSYICCQKPFCRDGARSQGFCRSDRECPVGYSCQNYERNRDGICCQRHVYPTRFQYA